MKLTRHSGHRVGEPAVWSLSRLKDMGLCPFEGGDGEPVKTVGARWEGTVGQEAASPPSTSQGGEFIKGNNIKGTLARLIPIGVVKEIGNHGKIPFLGQVQRRASFKTRILGEELIKRSGGRGGNKAENEETNIMGKYSSG